MSKQAPNLQAVLDWVKANRPDVLDTFKSMTDPNGGRSDKQDALLFLVTIGFQAGRQYQINHPELGCHSYHTDPELLHRPPVKTT